MKKFYWRISAEILLIGIFAVLLLLKVDAQPVSLNSENHHYLNYKGKPVFLLTSDQHYGAVTNLDFDYTVFLDTLAANSMNFTRIYPGAYIERDGEYMKDNNLGARNGRQILPWIRTKTPGAHEVIGGFKLDLDSWNEDYFNRLKDFVSKAQDRNILVDIAFFNGMYLARWDFQPMYFKNNIQGIGTCVFNEVQTLKDTALVKYQEAYVRKITEELIKFDNVILDICDEPFQDGCPPVLYYKWISRLIDVILETEDNLPKKHLIAQTVDSHTRGGAGDFSADERVRVMMNEYTWGIANLDTEYAHYKPMILIETAYYPQYDGDKIAASRVEAWEFMTGGGAGFMQLNGLYSTFNPGAAGTENPELLRQLRILKNYLESFSYIKMKQDKSFLSGGLPIGSFSRAVSEPGKQYALYIHHSVYGCWFWKEMQMGSCYVVKEGSYTESLELNFARGNYLAEWINPATGKVISSEKVAHSGGKRIMKTPPYKVDIALHMRIIK